MRFLVLAILAVALSGCGYVGEPLPPALRRPMRVTDLAAVERGAKIIVQFTMPRITTEGLAIKKNQDVELRYGASPVTPFRFDAWEKASQRVDSVPQDPAKPTELIRVELPAEKFVGKDLVIGVKVHAPSGKDIGWSNIVQLNVIPPLPTPLGLEAKDVPQGVRVDWHAAAALFRVYRKLQSEANWVPIGNSDKPFYIDEKIEYGKQYQYFVQTIEKTGDLAAESDLSAILDFKPTDTFPPAVPTGLTAVPGARSIELLWDRSVEKDLAGYRIYRDGKRLGETLPSPAYSDKAVQAGTKYKYQVSAIDNAGNESALSAAFETMIP